MKPKTEGKGWRTEAFKEFIRRKEMALDDLITVVDNCARKAGLLEEFFLLDWDSELSNTQKGGLACIMNEIEMDLHLVSDEIWNDAKLKKLAKMKTEDPAGKEAV
jgi:hypothetical protein